MNLVSLLLQPAAERPDAVALIEGARSVSFSALEGLAARTAGGIAALGVAPGDRVAIAAHNDVGFVTAYLGALWAGAVAVPLNPLAPGEGARRPGGAGRRQGAARAARAPMSCSRSMAHRRSATSRRRSRCRPRWSATTPSSRCCCSRRELRAPHAPRCSRTATSPRTSDRCRAIPGSRCAPTTSGSPRFRSFTSSVSTSGSASRCKPG